jgi:hypothetical protein
MGRKLIYCCEEIKEASTDYNNWIGFNLAEEICIWDEEKGKPIKFCPFCGSVITLTPKLIPYSKPEDTS